MPAFPLWICLVVIERGISGLTVAVCRQGFLEFAIACNLGKQPWHCPLA